MNVMPKKLFGQARTSLRNQFEHLLVYLDDGLVSLVSSAHRNDLDIFVSVKDVLDRLLAGETNYDDLRPDVWKQSHPEAIRIYRVEERRARADAKTVKRARRRIAKRG